MVAPDTLPHTVPPSRKMSEEKPVSQSHGDEDSLASCVADTGCFQQLNQVDPEGALLLQREMTRDLNTLNLSAPESYMTQAVREALAAPLPPSESYPGRRYHSGRHIINEIEELCWRRALETFELAPAIWGVNVQAFSGSLANLYTYTALMEPGETLLYMELSHGGHLSHGHQTTKAKVSETAHKFNAVPYQVDLETGIIDYDGLRSLAMQHNAKVITVGGSSYSRLVNYERMRGIADLTGALLHCDMAHICGLVAGRAIESPFPFCDVVTTTTYKSFCGPKGAMIFYRNWMKDKINSTVFPRYQAARDYSVVLAISVALLEAQSQKYREQQSRVVAGSRILAACLYEYGYTLVGGGTDNHMVVINLKDSHIEASHAEKALEMVHVVCNQNSIPGDKGGTCSGLRLGTPPMVIRGLPPSAFRAVAGFVHQALELTRAIQDEVMQTVATGQSKVTKAKTMEQFTEACRRHPGIRSLGLQVWRLVSSYPPPWHN